MLYEGKSATEQDGRRNETRTHLLEAALQLLVREGYERATTGRIAKAAGIQQSSFYSHFPSRDACLAEAVTLEADALIERLARRRRSLKPVSAAAPVTRQAISAGFVLALGHLAQRRELAGLVAMRDADHAAGEAVRHALERLRDGLVADLGRFGVAAPKDAAMRVELTMALTFQAAGGVRDGRYTLPAAVEVLTDQVIALLGGSRRA